MKKILLLSLISISTLFAELSEPIHSSFSTYYENKTFKNSVQKERANVYGVDADIHHSNSEYKLRYEYGKTDTIRPRLSEDLRIQKLFLRYGYDINNFQININYINILSDNIAITNHGKTFGAGVSYNFNKQLAVNFTQYYTTYRDFDVLQSDFKFVYKMKYDALKIKIASISKYININEKYKNGFTKNAQDDYLTTGLRLHFLYDTYHLGMGAYLGKRAFAIMSDGFKIQHHAMEFDRTYAIGIGKDISNFVIRAQYIYQRATEMPSKNENVEVRNLRLILNYKL